MVPVLGLCFVFLVMQLILLIFSVGLGFLLHWLIPGVEMGTGILAGAIVTCSAAFFFAQVVRILAETNYVTLPNRGNVEEDEDDDEEDDYEEDEEEEMPPPPRRRFSKSSEIGKHWRSKRS